MPSEVRRASEGESLSCNGATKHVSVPRRSLLLRHSSPQHTCCGLVFYSNMFLDLFMKIEIGHIEKSLSEKRKIITIHYTIEV